MASRSNTLAYLDIPTTVSGYALQSRHSPGNVHGKQVFGVANHLHLKAGACGGVLEQRGANLGEVDLGKSGADGVGCNDLWRRRHERVMSLC